MVNHPLLKGRNAIADAMRRALRQTRQMLRPETYLRGAALQERLDILRLYLLTEAHRSWPNIHLRSLDDVEDTAPRMHQQQSAVQSKVTRQILQMLAAWRIEQPPPLPLEAILDDKTPPDIAACLAELRAAVVAQHEAELRQAQRRSFGFGVRVGPSSATHRGSSAGSGVFIDGMARMGSVLALYPGIVFYPSDLMTLPTGVERFKGNEHLILRYDRTLLDASAGSLALVPSTATSCPLAVAHRVNHPPQGSGANALACSIELSASDVPAELHALLPNVRYQQVEWQMLSQGAGAGDTARITSGSSARNGPMAALDQMIRCAARAAILIGFAQPSRASVAVDRRHAAYTSPSRDSHPLPRPNRSLELRPKYESSCDLNSRASPVACASGSPSLRWPLRRLSRTDHYVCSFWSPREMLRTRRCPTRR
jgi:hypothetical protein